MKKSIPFECKLSGTVHLLVLILLTFFILPITTLSQVVVTETEEQMVGTGTEEPNVGEAEVLPLSDSAKALLRKYQLLHFIPYINAQPLITTCDNSDFGSGTFANWVGAWGTWPAINPKWYPNELDTNTVPPWPHGNAQCYNGTGKANCPPLHSIIAAPGTWDPNTGDSLISVFPGEAYSTRLGHNVGGTHKSQLKYTVYVDNTTYLFIYRYAVVLQLPNPPHIPPSDQPSFSIEIQNSLGAVIDSACGYYYIYAHLDAFGNPPPTWHKHGPVATRDMWKEWTTVGMSLVAYVGDTVSIVFKSFDCRPGGHFGYAYLSAFCNHITVQTAMCEGDSSATLTAPPGFSYLWNTGDTTASIVVPHPVTGSSYSCLLTAVNGCQVTIYDTLTYTAIHANFTHGVSCAGLQTQFTDSSYVSQNSVIGWNWNFGDTSPPVTGVQNPTHIYATLGDFNVTLIATSTDGCSDTVTKTIHVDSLPTITNNVLRQRICNNTPTNISLISTVSGTLYTWTTTISSPNISGYSNNPVIPGLFTNQTLTNSGPRLDSVIYHFTPHSSSCTGPVVDFTVEVAPVPLLTTSPLLKTICDSVNTNIVLTSNVDSTLFTWTCTANPGNNLSGYSNNALPGSLNISQVIYNSGYNIDTLHYHITGNAYGCSGPVYDYRVVVDPLPDLTTAPLNKSLCSQSFTNVNLTSHVSGTLFTWTCTPSGPGITGWANNAVPTTFLNQQLFNSAFAAGTVTYHITPHANNCDGHVYQYVVTVKPIPVVTNSVNPSQCSGSTTNIILTSDTPGSTFTWTASGSSGNVNGYSNNSGPVITQTLFNTGFINETVLYTVTASNNGCTGNGSGITVTVFPVADVYFTPASQVLCSAQNTGLTLASHVAGASFTWTASGSSGNVNGYSPGIGNSIVQTLNNIGINVETVTYTGQPTANNCPGSTGKASVTVNPVPSVTYSLCHDNITTTAAQPIRLTGGIPLGGNYSGAGVFGGIFDPSSAGIGNHTITYAYSNYLGCSRSATQLITVVNAPVFLCGNTLTDIRDNKQYATVKLGLRCWMAVNLNFGSTVSSTVMQRDNCVNEKYCYNDNAVNCTSYGGLYMWDEMMRYDNVPAAQGFCPPGWHVPTENEWNALFALYISNGFAGAPLKYSGYAGFNEYLSGVRHNNVQWDFADFAIMLWSSTEHNLTKAWAHGMNSFNPSVSFYPSSKTHAFAVRCIQD